MKLILKFLLFFSLAISLYPQAIDLANEYSNQEFQNGIRAFHDAEYERSITFFIKSLGYNSNNNLARYYLGESYRKAGYDDNAVFTWNNLLSFGYTEKFLKEKLNYIYNKKGMLNEININKKYVLREDIKGYYPDNPNAIFIKPTQICVDSNNHYYIASYMTNIIVELDSNFNIVKNHFPLLEKLGKPFGVAVDKEGFIYISDFDKDEIVKIDRLGVVKAKIGFKGIGKGGLLGPEYLLIDDESNLYVSDSGNHRINKYKSTGEFLFSFGASDLDPENRLGKPAGLFYDNNNIYVCDKEKNRVLIFDKSGNFLSSFGEDKLNKPYQITKDNYNRFMILCETELWVYDEENNLWYQEDALGTRLEKGISIALDKEKNLLITDFNNSRLFVLSPERERYTGLGVNIERIFSQNFPDVHLAVTVEKDNLALATSIDLANIRIYENSKIVPIVGKVFTENRDNNSDIMIIYDNNNEMQKYKNDFKTIANSWLKDVNKETNIGFVSINQDDPVLLNDLGSTRLSIIDSISNSNGSSYTDKGSAIKFSINHMLRRFSKKSVILVTNSQETGKDFDKFEVENIISLAVNNNVPIYIVAFSDAGQSDIYNYIAKKTGGEYYRVYNRSDLNQLVKKIEKSKGKELILSYTSKTISRFGEEPISVTIEVEYSGMKGISKAIYFPANNKPFYK